MQGIILKAISGFYYVSSGGILYECKARGNFRNAGVSPVVGDRVDFSLTGEYAGVVDSIGERRNLLSRPLIANIDKLFIVSSYSVPEPDALMIDRLTAIAVFHNIEPVIIFNKCDTGSFDEWYRIYSNAGFKTYVISAATGEGIDLIRDEAKGFICAFAGNSGVGKSSIINSVFGDLSIKTGEVSEKLGRGRHTTRHTQLFLQPSGGYVADTPGFSSVDTEEKTYDFKQNLIHCFPDLDRFSDDCKFTSCTHTCEKGCAVIAALKNGEVEISRHKSYISIFDELKSIKSWER